MARTYTPGNNVPGLNQRRDTGTRHAILTPLRHKVRISPFWRHFLEMFAAMMIGMMAGKPVFLAITGLSSTAQAGRLYPWQSVLGMGLSMTVPMVAWMLFRGHGRRNSAEMAAAMLVPAVPFIILCALHVLEGSKAAGVYMVVSTLAMLGLMVYRRAVYSMPMPGPLPPTHPVRHQRHAGESGAAAHRSEQASRTSRNRQEQRPGGGAGQRRR